MSCRLAEANYSQTTHPDFLWLPKRPTRSSVPHLDLDQVRMLLEMSVQDEQPTDPGEIVSFDSTDAVAIPDNNASSSTTSTAGRPAAPGRCT